MSILICGSMAFDTIMVFKDQFKNHILPESIHKLSVAFYVPELRKEFGGTAGNIAYNLKLLNEDPVIMATVGNDFSNYFEWLNEKLKAFIPRRPILQPILAIIKLPLFIQVQWWSHIKIKLKMLKIYAWLSLPRMAKKA